MMASLSSPAAAAPGAMMSERILSPPNNGSEGEVGDIYFNRSFLYVYIGVPSYR
jgi:hypothetical protein